MSIARVRLSCGYALSVFIDFSNKIGGVTMRIQHRHADVDVATMIIFIGILIGSVIVATSFIYQANILAQQVEKSGHEARTDRATRMQIIAIYGDRRGVISSALATFVSWTDVDVSAGLKGPANVSIVLYNDRVISQTLWINVTTNSTVSGGAATFGLNGSVQGDMGGGIISGAGDAWGIWYYFPTFGIRIRIQGPGPTFWYNGSLTPSPDRWTYTLTSAGWGNIRNIVDTFIKIELSPGSPQIDMNDTLLEISNGSVDRTLVFGSIANNTHYTAIALKDPERLWATEWILSPGTVIEIRINGTNAADPNMTSYWLSFGVQEALRGKFILKSGYPTGFEFKAPDIFKDRYIELY